MHDSLSSCGIQSGAEGTICKIKVHYYFKQLNTLTYVYCKACVICQSCKGYTKLNVDMVSPDIAKYPLKKYI